MFDDHPGKSGFSDWRDSSDWRDGWGLFTLLFAFHCAVLVFILLIASSVERRAWSVERGASSVERRAWSVERGASSVERRAWSVERGASSAILLWLLKR
jgi:hypothetical protein